MATSIQNSRTAHDHHNCSICMEELCSDQFKLRECGHEFHRACLAPWAAGKQAPSCPLCRRNIVHEDQAALNPAIQAIRHTPAPHRTAQPRPYHENHAHRHERRPRSEMRPLRLNEAFIQLALWGMMMNDMLRQEPEIFFMNRFDVRPMANPFRTDFFPFFSPFPAFLLAF